MFNPENDEIYSTPLIPLNSSLTPEGSLLIQTDRIIDAIKFINNSLSGGSKVDWEDVRKRYGDTNEIGIENEH